MSRTLLLASFFVLAVVLPETAEGQRMRFGSGDGGPMLPTTAVQQTGSPQPAGIPRSNDFPRTAQLPQGTGFPSTGFPSTSPPPASTGFGSSTLQPPAGTLGTVAPPPGVYQPPGSYAPPPSSFDPFSTQPPSGSLLTSPAPGGFPGTAPPNAGTLGTPFPPNQPPPSALYPNYNPSVGNWPQNAMAGFEEGPYLRWFSDLKLVETWIGGDGGDEVDINDVELGITMNYPNFLGGTQPLRISPGFIFHFWDGPSPPVLQADLPGQAYSGFFDFSWQTSPDQVIGGEIDFRFGVYTDFSTLTTNSWRFTGRGLGRMRLTPNVSLKAGVEYLDRLEIKMLPAGGIFWQPSQDVNLEIYFPRPKLARRWTQIGNNDVWVYLGGEYGGGSWTVDRTAGYSDQVDINDLRVFAGFEWATVRQAHGFFEAGYVFDRKLVYRVGPPFEQELADSFMLRGGFSF